MVLKNGGSVIFKFKGDNVELEKKLKELETKLLKVQKRVSKVGVAMTKTLTTAIVGFGSAAGKMAGDLEQSLGGAEAVYGDYYDAIVKKAKESSNVMGTSTNQYLEYANKIGSLMQGSGLKTSEAFDLTTKAMQRASDVASIMGISVDDAMTAITGAAKGNFTMMDNLGVAMNATSLQAYALSKGIKKSYTSMTQAEKVQLAYNMFLEQTTKYAGNYAKENDTLNGSLTTLKAEFQNVSAEIGKKLIPYLMKMVKALKNALNWWNGLSAGTKKAIMITAGIVAVVGPVLIIISKIITVITTLMPMITAIISGIKIMIAVTKLLFAVLMANPIGLIIAAIASVIAVLVVLYNKCEWFRNAVNAVITFIWNLLKGIFNFIKDNWKELALFLVNPFAGAFALLYKKCDWFRNKVNGFVSKVKQIFTNLKNGVVNAFNNMVNNIKAVPGKIASIPEKIKALFKALPNAMLNIGINIVKGLWKGAKDMKDWVVNKFKGLGKGILKGMKKALGIKSPSKEFAIIGRFSMLGYQEGLEQMQPQIDKAINGMFNLSPSMTGTMNNTLSPNVNVVNNVNVETDPLGQMVSKIKTFSGGAKNDYNYGYGG